VKRIGENDDLFLVAAERLAVLSGRYHKQTDEMRWICRHVPCTSLPVCRNTTPTATDLPFDQISSLRRRLTVLQLPYTCVRRRLTPSILLFCSIHCWHAAVRPGGLVTGVGRRCAARSPRGGRPWRARVVSSGPVTLRRGSFNVNTLRGADVRELVWGARSKLVSFFPSFSCEQSDPVFFFVIKLMTTSNQN